MHMATFFGLLVLAALANLINGKAGVGGFFGGGRPDTWLVTLALIAAMLVVAGHAVKSRWDGVFIDRENRISLSRFQLVLWTAIVVSALLTAGLSNAVAPAGSSPLAITIPGQIWALLGLGAFTAVAAPAIKDARRASARVSAVATTGQKTLIAKSVQGEQRLSAEPYFENDVLVKEIPDDARWIDLIKGDYLGSALVDVSKLQKLAFTVTLVLVYAMAIWASFKGIGPIQKLPEIDSGFVALLGISHAAYLADKQIGST